MPSVLTRKQFFFVPGTFSLLLLGSCSGVDQLAGSPGAESGGSSGSSSGGAPAGTGGQTPSTGGDPSTGGSDASGGANADGGTSPAGGAENSGGATDTGGTGSGGAYPATGGAGTGGEGAATGGDGSGSGGDDSGTGGAGPTLPPVSDYSQSGPFDTVMETGQGPGGGYTIYRPETLGEQGLLHAPIVFGPGIGQSVTVHTNMLTNFASHGFVVVGTPVLSGGPGDAENRRKMQDGLDWIVEQNTTSGLYEGKLWVDHAVSMGFSVGGTSAVEIGGDEAVLTVVSIHGHRASAALHGTMLQTTGTGDTVGMPLQQQTYDQSEVPTFLATLTGAPHAYIEQNGGGEERPAILAWMRYWIYGDTGAEGYFFGADCTLCKSPWENPQRKNWD